MISSHLNTIRFVPLFLKFLICIALDRASEVTTNSKMKKKDEEFKKVMKSGELLRGVELITKEVPQVIHKSY